jgi:putative FmdB family regulatory protein
MPLYEYTCSDCASRFEALRSMSDADAPIICPDCGGQRAERAISLFAAVSSSGKVIAGVGSSCGSCSSSGSACAGCSSRH